MSMKMLTSRDVHEVLLNEKNGIQRRDKVIIGCETIIQKAKYVYEK
jgi:hypothetical protein